MSPDKNLVNTVKDLEQTAPTSHERNQQEQEENDRRKEMLKQNEDYKKDQENFYR